MISYRIPPEDSNRIVTQFIPDTTGKTCEFRHVSAAPDTQFLPLVGWAVVVRSREDKLPEVTYEPVVDDECHGPIALGDLEEEVGPLTLVDIS
ncbi:hypothetical protein [Streptomyces sp. NBC_01760]|uniref:hypothetical protein n=1 Tax=Streptomyces sp. NBC_01760 TaxID=2975931 RepID=UPI002DDA017F|nr:hypothetical protein [Streptomyces sp. NBC_01760]WSC72144.1 hypothetical protein OG807_28760 [Streptomyces sp. NBC_01760]